jgi:hypothetical protein
MVEAEASSVVAMLVVVALLVRFSGRAQDGIAAEVVEGAVEVSLSCFRGELRLLMAIEAGEEEHVEEEAEAVVVG